LGGSFSDDVRFLKQAQGSPYVVEVFDEFEENKHGYIIMKRLWFSYDQELEYLKSTLGVSTEQARVAVQTKYGQAVEGLANEKGILVTDTHNGNIMFDKDHNPKLFDFGKGTVTKESVGPEEFMKMVGNLKDGVYIPRLPSVGEYIVRGEIKVKYDGNSQTLFLKNKKKDITFRISRRKPENKTHSGNLIYRTPIFRMFRLKYSSGEKERIVQEMFKVAVDFLYVNFGPLVGQKKIYTDEAIKDDDDDDDKHYEYYESLGFETISSSEGIMEVKIINLIDVKPPSRPKILPEVLITESQQERISAKFDSLPGYLIRLKKHEGNHLVLERFQYNEEHQEKDQYQLLLVLFSELIHFTKPTKLSMESDNEEEQNRLEYLGFTATDNNKFVFSVQSKQFIIN
jgi:hypothetical protein